MATKKEILKNLGQFPPEEIAEAVRKGVVTLYELGKESQGAFTPLLKKRVKEILASPPTQSTVKEDNVEKVGDSSSTAPNIVEENNIVATAIEEPVRIPFIEAPSLLVQDETDSNEIVMPSEDPQANIEITSPEPTTKPSMFGNPFSFSGRIRRLEYGLSFILFYVFAFICGFIAAIITGGSDATQGLAYLFMIPGYWFIWAQGAKRCHDRNNSGWYQIIPFYGLWMLFAEGDAEENDYGVSPK